VVSQPAFLLAAFAAFGLSIFSHAPQETIDPAKGVHISSRLPCDGSTNPQDEVILKATFSPGGWERAFNLSVFESKFCRFADFYFVCAKTGHDRWKQEWSIDNTGSQEIGRFDLNSCSAWGSSDPPQYVLTGSYKEGVTDKKLPWLQVPLKQVSSKPDVYEFTDPNGGTARLTITRR
jgi:hypothetical protein